MGQVRSFFQQAVTLQLGIVGLFLGCNTTACAAPIVTLTFTQYFDYGPPISSRQIQLSLAGQPSATWTATFDVASRPSSPFTDSPATNAQFTLDGLTISGSPVLTWGSSPADSITVVTPSPFTVAGTKYSPDTDITSIGFVSPPFCSQPCSTSLNLVDVVCFRCAPGSTNDSLQDKTRDVLVGVAAPEPGTLTLFALGGIVIAGGFLNRRRRPPPRAMLRPVQAEM